MTKKDYILIANVIKTYLDNHAGEPAREWKQASLIDGFCTMLKQDNPLFSADKFIGYLNK